MACGGSPVKSSNVERKKLDELDQETATYLRHFFHNHNGTSAMVVVYDECGTIVLVKMYKSKPYDTLNTDPSFNQNHAEKFLIADAEEIISQTRSRYEESIKNSLKEAKLRMCIFQSNSPCEPCSEDFIAFKKKIDQKLPLISGEIEFQIGRVWKFWRNKDGLRKLFGYQGNGKKKEFTWKEFNWLQFYDAFYKWLSERTTQTNQEPAQFASEKDIITYLNEVSTRCAIDLICEEQCRVKEQISSLSQQWSRKHTCSGCWKSKDITHCHYCNEDGHTLDKCQRNPNLPSLPQRTPNIFLDGYGNYYAQSPNHGKPPLLPTPPEILRNRFAHPGSRFHPPLGWPSFPFPWK